ncbi:MAG: family 20 glycosylhydrolase [Armatimonadota bacterium]
MSDVFFDLLPMPRVIAVGQAALRLPGALRLENTGIDNARQAQLAQLGELVLDPWLGGGEAVVVRAVLTPDFALPEAAGIAPALQAQAYELTIDREITLVAGQEAGLRHGLQTLKQLLENGAKSGNLLRCRIADWPRLASRGIHFDLAREMEYRPAHLKRVVELLAYLKMNTLHLYLENKFAYPSAPGVAPPNVMTPAQARELCDYAALFGITVIPQVNTLGHMEHFLHGEYEALREDPANSYNLCPTHPQARPFLAGLIADVAAAFRSPFIHVGYDESHSGVCPRCQAVGSPQEILADHLNWLNEQVKSHGARTMIYGDKFLSPRDFPRADAVNGGTPAQARAALSRVSRDILITDWHYTAPYGGTIRALVDAGFEVHCVTATNIYWHDSIPLHRGHHWIAESIDRAVENGATGAFNSNWEYYRGQFFDNFWFFQALAAERQWTDRPHDYVTFGDRCSSRLWGVEKDYYSDIAGLAEACPTYRRNHFLDRDVFEPFPWSGQIRFDHLELGDYLIRQVETLRGEAKRNADILRMLDLPGHILRYLGARALGIHLCNLALAERDRARALNALDGIREVALQLQARLDDGYRIYGGAVVDRQRLQAHLDQLSESMTAIGHAEDTDLLKMVLPEGM